MLLVQNAAAIEKDRSMFDVGFALGTKSGAVFGIKYFIMNDVAIAIDLIGAPLGRVHLGISAEVDYYPSITNEYAYIGLGLSFMYSIREIAQANRIVPLQSSILALNLAVGANTCVFQLPPAIESENKNNVATVFYCELGPALVLINSTRIDGIYVATDHKSKNQNWYFPNIELGVRQGPFTPMWIQ